MIEFKWRIGQSSFTLERRRCLSIPVGFLDQNINHFWAVASSKDSESFWFSSTVTRKLRPGPSDMRLFKNSLKKFAFQEKRWIDYIWGGHPFTVFVSALRPQKTPCVGNYTLIRQKHQQHQDVREHQRTVCVIRTHAPEDLTATAIVRVEQNIHTHTLQVFNRYRTCIVLFLHIPSPHVPDEKLNSFLYNRILNQFNLFLPWFKL